MRTLRDMEGQRQRDRKGTEMEKKTAVRAAESDRANSRNSKICQNRDQGSQTSLTGPQKQPAQSQGVYLPTMQGWQPGVMPLLPLLASLALSPFWRAISQAPASTSSLGSSQPLSLVRERCLASAMRCQGDSPDVLRIWCRSWAGSLVAKGLLKQGASTPTR